MTLKKFLLPNILIIFVLSLLNFTGIDLVFKTENDDTTNLTKYVQVHRSILSNYFGEASIDEMHKESLRWFAKAISDSTLQIENSPADTLFNNVNVSTIRESFARFEEAYLYVSNNRPEEDMSKL